MEEVAGLINLFREFERLTSPYKQKPGRFRRRGGGGCVDRHLQVQTPQVQIGHGTEKDKHCS